MKRLILLLLLFSGCAVMTPLQKSRLITVFHLIETAKYEEAKEIVEDMVLDKDASGWARTWYARGMLYQTAFQDGKRNNDKKKYELLPDQLYVAYRSFERARVNDRRGRLDRQIAPRYVYMGNEFIKMAENHYRKQEYEAALKAYEHAIRITQSPVLSVNTSNDLIYNTALAAFHAQNWNKAFGYLNQLNQENHAANVSHLLYAVQLEQNDTLAATQALREGIRKYEDHQELVVVLADLLYEGGETEKALAVLDTAIARKPNVYNYHYTRGLILQKTEVYTRAINAYQRALEADPEKVLTNLNIATCYYNMGVEIEENAAALLSNVRVAQEKAKSEEAFRNAVLWLDKLYDTHPEDQMVLVQLYELYRSLGVTDRARGIQRLF